MKEVKIWYEEYIKTLKDAKTTDELGTWYEHLIKMLFIYNHNFIIHIYKEENQFIKGESKEKIEIKFDRRINDTGNIYLEYKERRKHPEREKPYGMWVDGGFAKKNEDIFYLIGDKKNIWVFLKETLCELHNSKHRFRCSIKHPMSTSIGILLPCKDALELAIGKIEVIEGHMIWNKGSIEIFGRR